VPYCSGSVHSLWNPTHARTFAVERNSIRPLHDLAPASLILQGEILVIFIRCLTQSVVVQTAGVVGAVTEAVLARLTKTSSPCIAAEGHLHRMKVHVVLRRLRPSTLRLRGFTKSCLWYWSMVEGLFIVGLAASCISSTILFSFVIFLYASCCAPLHHLLLEDIPTRYRHLSILFIELSQVVIQQQSATCLFCLQLLYPARLIRPSLSSRTLVANANNLYIPMSLQKSVTPAGDPKLDSRFCQEQKLSGPSCDPRHLVVSTP